MGGEKRPALRLSGLVKEFEAIEQQNLLAMSPNQVKKWRNPKKRAIANLIGVIGDKEIARVTRDDAVAFREWWQKRIVDGLDIGTANKDIGHISKMLRVVDLTHQLKLEPIFQNLRLSGAVSAQRAAFTAKFVQEKILVPIDGGDGDIAAAYYRIEDGRFILIHTEVPYRFTGQGIGSQLARSVFDAIRASGGKVVLRCSFMGGYYTRHPEYSDIVIG